VAPETSAEDALQRVTHKVYFDVEMEVPRVIQESDYAEDEETLALYNGGRIVLGLFGDTAPMTVENFRVLCSGEQAVDGKMHYKGTTFHRIIPNFAIQGGDVTGKGGKGSRSIYKEYGTNRRFPDESKAFQINQDKFFLSMANSGPNTNGSQFFISTIKAEWLNGKNVIFGKVLEGVDVVKRMEVMGSHDGRTRTVIKISDSGQL